MSRNDPIRVGIAGALGRMGGEVIKQAAQRSEFRLAALFDRPECEGTKLGEHPLTDAKHALTLCDVIIDFSSGGASAELAHLTADGGGPALIIGSTGFSQSETATVLAASERIAIVKSGNFSIGVAVLAALVEQIARRLGPEDWDIEIFEAHHKQKRDAPSGTALALGEAAASGRGVKLADVEVGARARASGAHPERRPGDIGFSVMRGGEIVGEHSVVFAGEGEILTLSHSARDRRIFALGALRAAAWIVDRSPGLYGMKDVLALGD
jgi:4-hydroxy-tetrahydrodipicolinate reductase